MMDELSDEELQRLVEADDVSFQPPFTNQPMSDDLATYQHLFTALKQSPSDSLSPNFSATVVKHIQTRRRQSADRRFYLLVGVGLVVGLLVSFGLIPLVNQPDYQVIFQSLYRATPWLLFGLACLVIVQVLDHRLIRKRMDSLPS